MQDGSIEKGDLRFIRQKRVLELVEMSRSTLYERINAGSFPKPMKICGGRINYWTEQSVIAWKRAVLAAHEAAA